MATTQWYPKIDLRDRMYLLANGSTIRPPELERSESGKRVRIKGETKSHGSTLTEEIQEQWITRQAALQGTRIWCPIDYDHRVLNRYLGWQPEDTPAGWPSGDSGMRRVWWHFKHPALNYEAYLVASIWTAEKASTYYLRVELVVPFGLSLDYRKTGLQGPRWMTSTEGDCSIFGTLPGTVDTKWRDFAQAEGNASDTLAELTSTKSGPQGEIAREVMRVARKIDEMSYVEVPDLRDPANPSWLQVPFAESNCTHAFFGEVQDVIEAHHARELVRKAVTDLQDALKTAGLVTTLKNSDLLAAADLADDKALLLTIKSSDGEDLDHPVSIHLLTGVISITCPHADEDSDAQAAAHEWNETRFRAEFQGELGPFLGFNQKYLDDQHRKRTRQTIRVAATK